METNSIRVGNLFQNKKNNKTYEIISVAIEATDGSEKDLMVVYKDNIGNVYVREIYNFLAKFNPCI